MQVKCPTGGGRGLQEVAYNCCPIVYKVFVLVANMFIPVYCYCYIFSVVNNNYNNNGPILGSSENAYR